MAAFLSIHAVVRKVGLSKTTIYARMKDQNNPFPAPSHIGSVSRWLESAVDAWIERTAADQAVAAPPDCTYTRPQAADIRRTA